MMHYALPERKCLLHYGSGYALSMSPAAERLKTARRRAGYESAKSAAEAMGVPLATYTQHENGARGFPAATAQRYGRFFRVAPEWLIYGSVNNATYDSLGPTIYVKGEVRAGRWQEAWQYEPDQWEAFTGRADVSASMKDRFGLRVVGESMNELYPEGSIIECVSYDHSHPIENGKRVVVQRVRFDQEIETTVKQYQRGDDGIEWLVPRSSNPAFQTPIRVDDPGPEIERVEIIALVVSSVRPE